MGVVVCEYDLALTLFSAIVCKLHVRLIIEGTISSFFARIIVNDGYSRADLETKLKAFNKCTEEKSKVGQGIKT